MTVSLLVTREVLSRVLKEDDMPSVEKTAYHWSAWDVEDVFNWASAFSAKEQGETVTVGPTPKALLKLLPEDHYLHRWQVHAITAMKRGPPNIEIALSFSFLPGMSPAR